MDTIIRHQYDDPTANRMIDSINKGGIFLTVKEAAEIANKLEEYERTKRIEYRREQELSSVRNTFLKFIDGLQKGMTLNYLMEEFGFVYPNDSGSGWVAGGSASTKFGSYYKSKILHNEGGTGFSCTTKEYACPSDEEIKKNMFGY